MEGILGREALYYKYHDKIAGAKSLEDMEEIRFSIMEEESPYFSAVSQRVWGEYEQKSEELSNPMQESEVIAEPEPQNEAEAPKEQPQIDKSGAVNFHIAPETEESGGKGFAAKEKFRQNLEAIRTLEKIEGENRIATPEEQEILAKYVGWGAAMESKRLGLCQKSLFVVPNHLTEQWASDFLRLYPGANILAATKKDFEPANRKKFCSRIATGDYDAVIIGHTQFEKIPLSMERQASMIERQITEIEMAIEAVKAEKGERYTIKQMEKTKKSLDAKVSFSPCVMTGAVLAKVVFSTPGGCGRCFGI